jgi:hypothetical protein
VRDLERTVERVARELVILTDDYHALQKMGGENNPYEGLNEMFLEKRLKTTPTVEEKDDTDNSEDSK